MKHIPLERDEEMTGLNRRKKTDIFRNLVATVVDTPSSIPSKKLESIFVVFLELYVQYDKNY